MPETVTQPSQDCTMTRTCTQPPTQPRNSSLPRVPCAPIIRERRTPLRDAVDRASARLARVERATIAWMSRHSVRALRIGLGVVYLWFGALKLFPSLSPAEELVV